MFHSHPDIADTCVVQQWAAATQPKHVFFPWQLLSKTLILHCLVHETVRADHGTILLHQFVLSQARPEFANVRDHFHEAALEDEAV